MVSTVVDSSVQQLNDATKTAGYSPLIWHYGGRGDLLPAWGTRVREQTLLRWDRHERNWMWQGARTGLAKKVASAPNELSGGRNLTRHFRRVLDDAHFGAGWQVFLKRVIRDYLRHDVGAFVEIVAPGDPMKPPTGRVVGIAHLDSLRCFPTGDPEYPVTYWDSNGKLHLMHRTRVIHLVDMPDGDEANPGYGESALSRAITIANRSDSMTRYVDTQLDDKPAPGIATVTGMSLEQFEKMLHAYKTKQNTDNGSVWGRQLILTNPSRGSEITVNHTAFSQAPASWSFKEYVELDANALALALGTDVQEIWQLTGGGNLGSGQQSEILHAKSQNRAFGDLLTMLERAINFHVLPEALTFEFKRHDPYESAERANTAKVWADFVAQTNTVLSEDEQRELLANQVEAVRDAITDADGNIVRLIDTDPEPAETVENDTGSTIGEPEAVSGDGDKAAPENTTFSSVTYNGVTVQASSVQSSDRDDKKFMRWVRYDGDERVVHWGQPGEDMERDNDEARENFNSRHSCGEKRDPFAPGFWACWAWQPSADVRAKAIQATRLDFEVGFEDLLAAARDEAMTRRQFSIRLRNLIRVNGRKAMRDGLSEGGVEGEFSDDDENRFNVLLADQSQYVSQLGARLFNEDGISDAQATIKPAMWFNKSIQPFYDAGRLSAQQNGMFQWVLGRTEEHCTTCLGLSGQRHRLKTWHKYNLVPKSSKLACGGWLCDCRLSRTQQRARGRLAAYKHHAHEHEGVAA